MMLKQTLAYRVLLILYSGIQIAYPLPQLTLLEPNGTFVFIGQLITIHCTINNHLLAWESDEVIGNGDQKSFTSSQEEGTTELILNNNFTGFVNLTRNTMEEGVQVLESEIHFNVTSSTHIKNFTVTCRDIESKNISEAGLSVTYVVSDKNATEIRILTNESELCSRDIVAAECKARNSTAIQFSSSTFSGQVVCRKEDMSRGNITIDNLTLEVIDSEAEVLICILYTEAKHTFGDNTSFTCLSVNIGVSATTTLKINELPADSCERQMIPEGSDSGQIGNMNNVPSLLPILILALIISQIRS